MRWVAPLDKAGHEVFAALDGTRRGTAWVPVRVALVTSDEGKSFAPSEFPWLGTQAQVLRPRAVEVLREPFVRRVAEAGLSGPDFVDVWSA
ncbi:MAG: hypothetical protein AB7Q97_04555 [Gammaproteobacteria bacterium]